MHESKKVAPDRDTFRIFWQETTRNRRLLWLSLLFPLGAIFMYTIVPLYIGKIVAALANPDTVGIPYLPQLIVFSIIGWTANRLGFTNFLPLQAVVMSQLERRALSALMERSSSFHNNNISGKLVSQATDYPKAFQQLAGASIGSVPFLGILIVGCVIVLSQSLILGLIVVVMALFTFLSGFHDSRRRAPIRAKRLVAGQELIGHTADTIVNIQSVKTFATEELELKRNHKLSLRLRDLRATSWAAAAVDGSNRIATLMILQVAFVVALALLIKDDPSLLSIGIFSLSFTATIFNRLFDTFTTFRQIEEALLQASPMTKIILDDVEIRDSSNAPALKVTKGAINLDDVSFKYTDQEKEELVFTNLSFEIKPGERVGLVGPSGGGKSTLTRLLLRFEDIQGGNITIDSQNIAEVSQSSLRKAISYVPQEPLLFHRSIRENIAYGKIDASDKEVVTAAKKAHAHEFIQSLASGYDTIVGERGVKLSGGQRQRIAIARAILKNAPILVLDEATSALDSESEVVIQEALWELMKGRTTLVIAHRLSTIQKMDRIIVLDDGRIVEEGNHKALLKQKGLYARLWEHQSGGFIEE